MIDRETVRQKDRKTEGPENRGTGTQRDGETEKQ